MIDKSSEQRQYHGLRALLDNLLAAGAVITCREPVRVSHAGRTYTVMHGMLLCDRLDATPQPSGLSAH